MAKTDRPPNVVDVTPSGFEIQFWDSTGVDGKPQQRRYRVDGERFVNVTTIVNVLSKEALLGWVERLTKEGKDWRDERDAAAERGTDSHDLILRFLMGKRISLSDLPNEYRPWGQAGFRWLRARRPKVEQAETMVACPSNGYAGRLDLLGDIDGARTLADYKTITKWSFRKKDGQQTDEPYPPYNENLLQLDLLQGALIESGYDPAERGLIVRLGPDGRYDETFVDLDPERGAAILGAYRANLAAGAALRSAFKATRTKLESEAEIKSAVEAVLA